MTDLDASRVLVVDDNDVNRLLVVETLAPDGIEVVEASSGTEALTLFGARPFDVVLMDVRMPGLDGFATLERMRVLPGGDDVPVVFLTALRDIDTFDRARAAGAVDFLTKPVRPSELHARVATLLQLRRLGVEVRTQLAEIRRQRDDLMRVQLQKERLATFVVHDLKNPLSSMKLHAMVALRTPDLPAPAREAATAIREQCDRLSQLVMNLLDLSKADEGQLGVRRAEVDVRELAAAAITALEPQAQQRRVTLTSSIGEPLPASIDGDLVGRVLTNLVDNALRHTPAGGSVTIEGAREGRELVLRVRDTGHGVPEAMREKIFDPFVQIEAGSAATRSGRGLGLSFCRAAAQAHGGTIAVESTTSGACFVVRLPNGDET